MKKALATLISACFIAVTAHADSKHNHDAFKEVSHEIDFTAWSLQHSSLSKTINKYVLDGSLSSLQRAQEELGLGNLRTAREWIRKASVPLVQMQEDAMAGKHPDPLAYKLEIRETLSSLLPVAEQIAAEKSSATDFIDAARSAMTKSDALLKTGQFDTARTLLEQTYAAVQQQIAELRRGDFFYLTATRTARPEDWLDGLNRIEERRAISQYLIIEAQSEGTDTLPLQSGLQLAEATVADAAQLALDKQWAQALEKLDLAYAQYETSWRAAGVDW